MPKLTAKVTNWASQANPHHAFIHGFTTDTMKPGLLVKVVYINQILDGKKKYEYRNNLCPRIDEKVLLVKRGCAYGCVVFDRNCKGKLGYKYGWHIKSCKKFKPPKKYKIPRGPVIWIKNVKITGLCKKTDKFPYWTSK